MPYLHLSQAKNLQNLNLVDFFRSKTSAERQAFASLVNTTNRFKEVIPSQTNIGAGGGATRNSGIRWLNGWTSTGIVQKQHRRSHVKNHALTCKYDLHPSLFNNEVRNQLSQFKEFEVVFKCTPVPRQIEAPYYGRVKHNINVLLSVKKPVISQSSNIDNEHYVTVINKHSLFRISSPLLSAGFEAPKTCQTEKSPELPGYDPNMTREQKIAYVLARDAALKAGKNSSNEPKPKAEMPQGLSSYEQGQWLKAQMTDEQRGAYDKLSRDRLESRGTYEGEFLKIQERNRRMENYQKNRIYN